MYSHKMEYHSEIKLTFWRLFCDMKRFIIDCRVKATVLFLLHRDTREWVFLAALRYTLVSLPSLIFYHLRWLVGVSLLSVLTIVNRGTVSVSLLSLFSNVYNDFTIKKKKSLLKKEYNTRQKWVHVSEHGALGWALRK